MLKSVAVILMIAGCPLFFAQSDTTPPALMSITITPNQVNVSSSPATFSVDLGIRDDGTGFNWGVLSFTSPSGKQQVYANPNTIPISDTIKNGVFRATVTMPQAAEAGIWQISSITLMDATGNSASWPYAVLTGQGFQTGVTVVDQQSDVTPPALMSITITPNQVNVSSSPATFSVDLGIRDDGTGFNWGVLSFTSPSGKQQVDANPNTIPISGTIKNGVFRATVTMPQAAEAGIWQISSINLMDATGNSASWPYAVLTGQGFQTGVTVVDQQSDVTPPALMSITITPNQVNVSSSPATFGRSRHPGRRHGFQLGSALLYEPVWQAASGCEPQHDPDFRHHQERRLPGNCHHATSCRGWHLADQLHKSHGRDRQ